MLEIGGSMRWFSLVVAASVGCSSSDEGAGSTDVGPADALLDTSLTDVGDGATPEASADAPKDSGFDIPPVDAALPPPGPCAIAGSKEAFPCGVCGRTERVCLPTKMWGPFSTCAESPPECSPWETRTTTTACGKCGKEAQTCSSFCKWEKSGCGSEGPCAPGDTEDVAGGCSGVLEVKTRVCGTDCAFGAPGACHLPKGWQKLADPPVAFGGRTRGVGISLGTQILQFGGTTFSTVTPTVDAALYTIATDSWTTTTPPIPNRELCAGVFTGTEALIWGGIDSVGTYPADGARYKPGSGWSKMASAPIVGRWLPIVAWSDATKELVVWGGSTSSSSGVTYHWDGAAYAPATNTWRTIPAPPLAREFVSGGSLGGKLLIYGGIGSGCGIQCQDAQLYDAATNTWSALGKPTLSERRDTAIVLGATLDVMFGADKTGKFLADGAHYAGTWSAIKAAPATTFERRLPWTFRVGTVSYIWSGADKTGNFRVDGVAYDRATSTWSNMPTKNAPSARNETTFVFTGTEAYMIGGVVSAGGIRDAYVFRP